MSSESLILDKMEILMSSNNQSLTSTKVTILKNHFHLKGFILSMFYTSPYKSSAISL